MFTHIIVTSSSSCNSYFSIIVVYKTVCIYLRKYRQILNIISRDSLATFWIYSLYRPHWLVWSWNNVWSGISLHSWRQTYKLQKESRQSTTSTRSYYFFFSQFVVSSVFCLIQYLFFLSLSVPQSLSLSLLLSVSFHLSLCLSITLFIYTHT